MERWGAKTTFGKGGAKKQGKVVPKSKERWGAKIHVVDIGVGIIIQIMFKII